MYFSSALCLPLLCQNGGICNNETRTCECSDNVFGDSCECGKKTYKAYSKGKKLNINQLLLAPCRDAPCLNGGVCTAFENNTRASAASKTFPEKTVNSVSFRAHVFRQQNDTLENSL